MRLALAMGRPDVDGMLDEITHEQMDEWIAFDNLEGVGLERLRFATALGLSAVAKGVGMEISASDLLLDDAETEEQTAEEQIGICRLIAARVQAAQMGA